MKLTKTYLKTKEAQFRAKQGKLLESSRKQKGLSQAQVGESVGLSQDIISNFEVGKTNVSSYRLLQLAKLYNKPVSFFFRATDVL